jgi:hypothetical protein
MTTLPFVMPDPFSFKKRVLAHRVPSFPLQIGSQPAATDYYQTQFLQPTGENGKHAYCGGFIRDRPLVFPVSTPALNMQLEVSMAIAQGITGFCLDIQGLNDTSVALMLAAAAAVDPRFWCVLTPDMNALGPTLTQDQMVALVATYSDPTKYPNIARLPDNRMLLNPYDAPLKPLSWWQGVISTLNSKNIDVALVPVLPGDAASNPLASISHGWADWGTATLAAAQARTPCLMMPILAQQFRPDDLEFWEAGNFDCFVASWMKAIASTITDFAMLVTWNDFSESSQHQPFTDSSQAPNIGNGFYQLNGYFGAWFLSGTQPQIIKDALFYCYRKMPSTALRNVTAQPQPFKLVQPGTETDQIEVLAFLVTPATVLINGVPTDCPAGITPVKAPTAPGNPVIALQRDGSDVFRGTCPVPIYGSAGSPAGTLDLTYWSGVLHG